MLLLLAIALETAVAPVVPLDGLAVGDALTLHGRVVVATITVGQPVDTLNGLTIAGRDVGGLEVGVLVPADATIGQGDTLTVVGRLKVTTTPPAVVDGRPVPAFTSVAVVGVRVR